MPLQLPTVTVARGLEIVTRDGWAENRPPRGVIQVETDVRFLLVHHTAEPGNDYGPGDAPGLLRSMYDFHTGYAKGWPEHRLQLPDRPVRSGLTKGGQEA